MIDHRVNDLLYGHLGEAIYDPETKSWTFNRQPGHSNILEPVGSLTNSLAPPPGPSSPVEQQSYQDIHKQACDLAKSYPELVPAVPLLSSLAFTSQAITATTSIHDPTTSDRLAFGKAADLENQRSGARTVPIVAVPGGEAGEAVRLIQVREEQLGWGTDQSPLLGITEIGGGEEALWVGDGGTVQQIRFAQSAGESSTWMAVRLLTTTVILRPLYHRVPFSTSSLERYPNSCGHAPSRLDPNPIVTLSLRLTGDAPHADVCFNPWYEKQFAVVDQKGNWSVWDVEGQKSKRSTLRTKAGKSGHISQDFDFETGESLEEEAGDGWGRICWAGDVNTLVVCNRRHMAVFDLKATLVQSHAPDLGLRMTSDWILDVSVNLHNQAHVFVLTSARLFWLEITSSGEDIDEKDVTRRAKTLLSWRHFRDREDVSLRLQLTNLDEVSLLLLYSRMNNLITVFQFHNASETSVLPLSVADPFTLTLPPHNLHQSNPDETVTKQDQGLAISAITLQTIDYIEKPNVIPKGPGALYMDHEVRFFQLYVLFNDLSLFRSLYSSGIPSDGWQRQEDRYENVSNPETRLKKTGRAARSATKVTGDSFIVSDFDVDSLTAPEDYVGLHNSSPKLTTLEKPQRDEEDDQWTVNAQWMYDMAFRSEEDTSFSSGTSTDSQTQGFSDYLQKLRDRLAGKAETGFRPIETLFELCNSELRVGDPGEASSQLRKLVQLIMNSPSTDEFGLKLVLTNLALPSVLGFAASAQHRGEGKGEEEDTGFLRISDTFRTLIDRWLVSLSRDVPGKTRLGKEKVVRKVAAELCLASIGISLRPISDESDRFSSHPQFQNLHLPVRQKDAVPAIPVKGKGRLRELPRSSSQRSYPLSISSSPSIPSLRTPTPTSSLHSQTSTSSSRAAANGEDPSSVRLRAYTSLSLQPPLPPKMSNLLSHWTVGANPDTYDWEATSAALAPLDDAEGGKTSGLTVEAQAKLLRRQERSLKRARRDTVAGPSSQPAPTRLYGSQPQAAAQSVQATQSSQLVEDPMPMSQVERGVFGGRQAGGSLATKVRKKKKKRAAGF
ncbi:MAG: hypothetical protein M1827_005441 [Pycnora praestabilis]|nr:MAG: hypothetical protein M1827_005441 [Pycnora praestabilis]